MIRFRTVGPVLIHAWGSEVAVYHEASQATHVMADATAALLQRLQLGPATWPQLVTAASRCADLPDTPEAREAYLEACVANLVALALVESAEGESL